MAILLIEPGAHRRPYDRRTVDTAWIDEMTLMILGVVFAIVFAAMWSLLRSDGDYWQSWLVFPVAAVVWIPVVRFTDGRNAVPRQAHILRKTAEGLALLAEGTDLANARRNISREAGLQESSSSEEHLRASWKTLIEREANLLERQQVLIVASFP